MPEETTEGSQAALAGISETQFTVPDAPASSIDASTNIQNELAKFTQETEEDLTQTQAQLGAAESEKQGFLNRFTSFFEGKKSTEQLQQEQFERFGIEEDQERARELTTQLGQANMRIANLMEQKDLALASIEGSLASTLTIDRRTATQERRWNSRINAESARAGALGVELEAVRGNITQARALANDVVNAILADQESELQQLNFFFELNQDLIDDLQQEERDLLNQVREDKKEQLRLAKEEKDRVMDLLINNPFAGVKVDDSVESALGKVRDWNARKPDLETVSEGGFRVLRDSATGEVISAVFPQGSGGGSSSAQLEARATSLMENFFAGEIGAGTPLGQLTQDDKELLAFSLNAMRQDPISNDMLVFWKKKVSHLQGQDTPDPGNREQLVSDIVSKYAKELPTDKRKVFEDLVADQVYNLVLPDGHEAAFKDSAMSEIQKLLDALEQN